MESSRDPYPFPKLENDLTFSSRQEPPQHKETLPAGKESMGPWTRLYTSPTLSSARRDVTHFDPQAPHDSLDFVLKCQYDHHGQFMNSKAEVLRQPETIGLPHGRVLKNRAEVPKPLLLEEKELVHSTDGKKISVHSSKGLAIESHHSESTNQGYSRKHDGGFYSC